MGYIKNKYLEGPQEVGCVLEIRADGENLVN